MCINYTGAELYASDPYQKTLGGAFILIPVANEYRDDDGRVQGYWSPDYFEIVHSLFLDFIETKTNGVGLKVLLGRLERMKNAFLFLPEWTRNGDKGIADHAKTEP